MYKHVSTTIHFDKATEYEDFVAFLRRLDKYIYNVSIDFEDDEEIIIHYETESETEAKEEPEE